MSAVMIVERALRRKTQNYQHHQGYGQDEMELDFVYRILDELGAVIDDVHLHARRGFLLDGREQGADVFHHLHGIRTGLPVHRELYCALVVEPRLHLHIFDAILRMADVDKSNRHPVRVCNSQIVEALRAFELAGRFHREVSRLSLQNA